MATPKNPRKPTSQPASTPPVDNDHVEEGAEKFDETVETGQEPEPTSNEGREGVEPEANRAIEPGEDATPQEVVVQAPKRHIRDRVRDIEKRWGKEFTEVMVDLHDHVFGTSPPHEEDEG